MKKCHYCNSEILDEAVFCVHCKSTLDVIAVKEANPDVKICTYCGNECNKNAVLCVKCGSGFKNEQKTSKNKSCNINTVVSTASIVLRGIYLICLIISFFVSWQYYGLNNHLVDLIFLLNIIVSGIALAGLILGKKNKIVAIGYGFATLISMISLFTEIVGVAKVVITISVVCNAIIALLYTGNKALRKVWFIPPALSFLSAVITIILHLVWDMDYFSSYYYGWLDFLLALRGVSYFFSPVIRVIITAVTSYNAKLNWYDEE